MKLKYNPFVIYLFVLVLIFSTYFLSLESIENFINIPLGSGKMLTTPFSKSFKIEDRMFGWRKWWRNNQSYYAVKNDNSFKGTAYETYSSKIPLLYDGVRNVSETSAFLP
jgi:hypothetical protein